MHKSYPIHSTIRVGRCHRAWYYFVTLQGYIFNIMRAVNTPIICNSLPNEEGLRNDGLRSGTMIFSEHYLYLFISFYIAPSLLLNRSTHLDGVLIDQPSEDYEVIAEIWRDEGPTQGPFAAIPRTENKEDPSRIY